MEREAFFSGYCRMLDNSRMVCVCAEGDTLTEVDCSYEGCPFTCECTVAQKTRELLKSE